MAESKYNPNDPEFLASCGIDEPLSDDEREQLTAAMRKSNQLSRFQSQIAAVNRLIEHCSEERIELDWEAHLKLIEGRIAEGDEACLGVVDELVCAWASDVPQVEPGSFTRDVLERIRTDRGVHLWRRQIFRIGAPLAAAAIIALAVGLWVWQPFTRQPIARVVYQMPARESSRSAAAHRAVVQFVRSAPKDFSNARPPTVSILAMGSSPVSAAPEEEVPPL